MNSKSAFKLIVLILTWLKISLISLPFTIALVNLKQGKFQYGYDFFELNFNAALLIAIAIGLVFSIWNAFEFEDIKGWEISQYMKTNQRYALKTDGDLTESELSEKLVKITSNNKRWKILQNGNDGKFVLGVKNFLGARDVITISRKNGEWEMFSRPKWKIEMIDLGRNFKNIEFISSQIKRTA